MDKKLFTAGAVMFIASFFVPVSNEGLGYMLAYIGLTSWLNVEFALSDIFTASSLTVTNVAGLVILISYARFYRKFVTVLGVLGMMAAAYWLFNLLTDEDIAFLPYATICWLSGIALMTIGYEWHRRSKG